MKNSNLSPYMVYKVQDLRQNNGAFPSTDLVLIENPSLPKKEVAESGSTID